MSDLNEVVFFLFEGTRIDSTWREIRNKRRVCDKYAKMMSPMTVGIPVPYMLLPEVKLKNNSIDKKNAMGKDTVERRRDKRLARASEESKLRNASL